MNIEERAQALVEPLGSLINLVTFDSVDIKAAKVTKTVDPLMVILTFPLISTIRKEFHQYLREAIRDYIKAKELYSGKIDIEYEISIKIYAKKRITPVWTPEG